MIPISKRYSTYCNAVTIVCGAVMPFAGDVVPHQYQAWVMMGLALLTAVAQGIRQGKFDDVDKG